jgi:DNA-binding SARP family transcriptional activator/tetratricopeptide (TPR) repeat protein
LGEPTAFRILGALEVWIDSEQLALHGRRHEKLLSAMLLNVGKVTPLQHLVDVIWNQNPPSTADKQVRNAASSLRTLLASTGASISAVAAGYRLDIPDGTLDHTVFELHVARARRHAGNSRLVDAVTELRSALALWRGPALIGLDSSALEPQIVGLNESRVAALEYCNDLRLRLGHHRAMVSELSEWVSMHPLRERLASQLMLALYRSGRQADALSVYNGLQQALADELGVSPGYECQELRNRILSNDDHLVSPDDSGTMPMPAGSAERGAREIRRHSPRVDHDAGAHRPAQLPSVVNPVIGRDSELRTVTAHMSVEQPAGHTPVVVVEGPPGVGKTTLALRGANNVADWYPDGILFADLHGYSDLPLVDPADVLEQFLLALGISAPSVPRTAEARASLFRSVLRGRRVLVVLDNVTSSTQVRLLLPNSPGCCVLVTSRTRLSGLVIRQRAVVLSLSPLRSEDAVEVLGNIVGRDRVSAEVPSAIELVERCSGIPLALCVAAERVASRPQSKLADLVDDLTKVPDQLGWLTGADADDDTDVRKVFSWSYRALDEPSAYLFRTLTLAPGAEISAEAAAALTECSLGETHRRLDKLVSAHLLQETAHQRYAFHDLLRVYASELNRIEDREAERRQSVDRLLRWYLAAVHAGSCAMAPYRRRPPLSVEVYDLAVPVFTGWTDAVQWCERELQNLDVVTGWALHSRHLHVAHDLPIALWDFFYLRKPWSAWISMNKDGLEAARRSGNEHAEAWSLCNLGVAHLDLGELAAARSSFSQSLEVRRRIDAPTAQGWSMVWLGNTLLATGDLENAAGLLEQALDQFIEVGDRWATGICRGYLGCAYTLLERYDEAHTHLGLCEHTLRDMADRQGEGCALDLLAKLFLSRGDWASAREYLHRAIDLRAEIGDRRGQADTLFTLGKAQQERGHAEEARETYRNAYALFTDLGAPEARPVLDHLEALDAGVYV